MEKTETNEPQTGQGQAKGGMPTMYLTVYFFKIFIWTGSFCAREHLIS